MLATEFNNRAVAIVERGEHVERAVSQVARYGRRAGRIHSTFISVVTDAPTVVNEYAPRGLEIVFQRSAVDFDLRPPLWVHLICPTHWQKSQLNGGVVGRLRIEIKDRNRGYLVRDSPQRKIFRHTWILYLPSTSTHFSLDFGWVMFFVA